MSDEARPASGGAPDSRTFVADRGDEGVRLDVLLTRQLTRLRTATRTRVQRWIDAGKVRVNGRVTPRPARPLHAGDVIEIELPWRRTLADHQPEDIPLDLLFEDAHLLIVSKPAGMLVHPTGRHRTGTLFNALLWQARAWPDNARPGLVHRLDRGTSGVIVVAKSRLVHVRTVRLLRGGRARKRYLAIVSSTGRDRPPDAGTIRIPLTRVSDAPPRMGPAAEGSGLACETRFEVLARGAGAAASLSLMACDLVTGRLHQIRAHLHAAGWPIVGDPIYGPSTLDPQPPDDVRAAIAGLGRQALHAWQLALPHPMTDEPIEVTAPLPDEMRAVMGAAGFEGWLPGLPSDGVGA